MSDPAPRKRKVAVIGAGPAGLAAAARLLERAKGNVEVKVLHMGHHMGGKAATYQDAKGDHIEHGWHMLLGFYRRMKSLMARAGVRFEHAFSSMHGRSHCYEAWSDRLHVIDGSGGRLAVAGRFMTYDGLPELDRANFNRFMVHAFTTAMAGGLEHHDDICWDAWAHEAGLRPHITKYSFFRMFREVYFNFPEQISAYHMLKTLSLMNTSEDTEIFVCRGRYSDVVWEPIAEYIKKLGGTFESYAMVTDLRYDGPRVTGLVLAKPDGAGHHDGATSWTTNELPREASSERVYADFDDVICTVPAAVFVHFNKGDRPFWNSPFFARIRNLRSASTVGMRIITKKPLRGLPDGPIFGIPAPLGNAARMTPHLTLLPDEAKGGEVVDFVGQEPGFENWKDDQIVDFTLHNVGYLLKTNLTRSDLAWYEFHRNRSDHERIFLCEPGVQKFRPTVQTPFRNFYLAGDWVKNSIDLVCMEGAITAAEEAVDLLLERGAR